MYIARCVRARENKSDVESELESEDPTKMGDDVISSEDEEGQEVIVTLVEHREPTATSTSSGWDVGSHGDVPPSRKHAASSNAIGEREVKRPR